MILAYPTVPHPRGLLEFRVSERRLGSKLDLRAELLGRDRNPADRQSDSEDARRRGGVGVGGSLAASS